MDQEQLHADVAEVNEGLAAEDARCERRKRGMAGGGLKAIGGCDQEQRGDALHTALPLEERNVRNPDRDMNRETPSVPNPLGSQLPRKEQ